MSKMLSAGGFKWVENTSQFSKHFTEKFSENSNEGYFFETDVQYLEKLHDIHNDLLFFVRKNENWEIWKRKQQIMD